MELSALAFKALISFSLGLNANTAKNPDLSDSLKTNKPSQNLCIKKGKINKSHNLGSIAYKPKKEPVSEQKDMCSRCGRG